MTKLANAPVQPGFDPRIFSLAFPPAFSGSDNNWVTGNRAGTPSNLSRGYMIWDAPITNMYKNRCVFNFLYNPSEVFASYNMPDIGMASSLIFPNPGDVSDLRIPINQTASWTLLFDRTYEVNDPKASPTMQKFGVYFDIRQLQAFTGMMTGYSLGIGKSNANDITSNPDNTSSTAIYVPETGNAYNSIANQVGIMQMIPAWVYFGGTNTGQTNGNDKDTSNNGLNYYGFVSYWDVTYAAWTQDMVPYRAQVDITFQLLPPTAISTSTSSAGYYVPTKSGTGNGSYINNPVTGPVGRGG